MEGVKTFLESSSIGGLNHIATSKKLARLFWISAVLTCFTGAGFLIQLSFQSWSESPVKTMVEILPLSRITLPKVTVCPPKNTFTDLNYDLMRAENFALGKPLIKKHLFLKNFKPPLTHHISCKKKPYFLSSKYHFLQGLQM